MVLGMCLYGLVTTGTCLFDRFIWFTPPLCKVNLWGLIHLVSVLGSIVLEFIESRHLIYRHTHNLALGFRLLDLRSVIAFLHQTRVAEVFFRFFWL